DVAVNKAKHRRREAANQPFGTGCNGVEHRLRVGRRGGDYLEDVGGCGLAVWRGAELALQPRYPGWPCYRGSGIRSLRIFGFGLACLRREGLELRRLELRRLER